MGRTATVLKDEADEAPLVWREHDASRINKILNHPEVRSWVADAAEGEIDVTPQVSMPDNVLLMGKLGACFFFHIMPGVYEVHSQCLPQGRGRWMAAFAEEALKWMFTKSPCWEVVTRIPGGHAAARALTVSLGFIKEFTREKECKFRGQVVPMDVYRLSIHDWTDRSRWAESLGEDFHDQLHGEAERLGITATAHDNDPQHNRIAGMAVEMARNGQVVKAILFYDRWSFIARHSPVALVSERPPIVKMDIGNLHILPNGIRVEP